MFKARRDKLVQKLDNNSVVIIATNPEQKRNNDVDYPFRAGSSFYYFTGFCEPNSLMILSSSEYIVFMQEKDSFAEMWNGERLGLEEGTKTLGAITKDIDTLDEELPKILEQYDTVYFDFENIPDSIYEHLTTKPYASIKESIAELRVIKDELEIENIKQACRVSDEVHTLAMREVKNSKFEYQVQSVFDGKFTFHNKEHAYPPIVASGANALILHYTNNDKELRSGDLLLIDAGCEHNNYASDITRTFPINGKFSTAQAQIYELVLRAQLSAIEAVEIGKSIKHPHAVATEVIEKGLRELGILTTQKVTEFFPHGTSHFLGLDVHDFGKYTKNGEDITLQKGMVITVEPGIYITSDDKIDEKYWNIGVRIEDDILVTKEGAQVLTHAPKTINEIENIMA